MVVLPILPPVAQHSYRACIFGVIRGNSTPLAIGSEILARIKTEAGHVSDTSHWPPFVLRPMRLSGILDHNQLVPSRNIHDWIHVGWLAVEMNRKDRFRPGGDGGFNLRWI